MRSSTLEAHNPKAAVESNIAITTVTAAAQAFSIANFRLVRMAVVRCGYVLNCQHDGSATATNLYRTFKIDGVDLSNVTEIAYSGVPYTHALSSGERLVKLGPGAHQLVLNLWGTIGGLWNSNDGTMYAVEI
jgi:hypothetical protein